MKIKLTVSSYGFSDRLQHISVVVPLVSLHHVSQPHLSSNCPSGSICRLSPVGCMQRERRGVPPCSTSRGSLDCPGILPGALPKLYLHCRLTGKEGSVCKRGERDTGLRVFSAFGGFLMKANTVVSPQVHGCPLGAFRCGSGCCVGGRYTDSY